MSGDFICRKLRSPMKKATLSTPIYEKDAMKKDRRLEHVTFHNKDGMPIEENSVAKFKNGEWKLTL